MSNDTASSAGMNRVPKDQESVVTMLEGFEARGEGVAQTMWESAMAIANNKHSKTA